jgi:histidyl-tRNA synthetase
MGERNMFPAEVQRASADVLLTVFDASSIPETLRLAGELRRAGMRVEVYPEPDKLGKQMKYAASRTIPTAAILGGDEIARGQVTLKNLQSGTQESVPRGEVVEAIKRALVVAGA